MPVSTLAVPPWCALAAGALSTSCRSAHALHLHNVAMTQHGQGDDLSSFKPTLSVLYVAIGQPTPTMSMAERQAMEMRT